VQGFDPGKLGEILGSMLALFTILGTIVVTVLLGFLIVGLWWRWYTDQKSAPRE
jgi:hypothetical protein